MSITFTLSLRDFAPGDYTVTINATDVYGQTVNKTVSITLFSKYKCPTVINF